MHMEKGDCCEMDEKTGVLQLYTTNGQGVMSNFEPVCGASSS